MASHTNWSGWHHQLHRRLLQSPQLLPAGSTLVLAISGGQDSMALLGLLRDLEQQHHWRLQLWHGDHGWHQHSGVVAAELAVWCRTKGMELQISRAEPGQADSEASARSWRYSELGNAAKRWGGDVVTAHTASDRAEGVLMNLARGCDIHGLSTLRDVRPLDDRSPDGPRLRRPLLQFTRADTADICATLQLPIWVDPSNADQSLERNRIRHQVMPVLDELHPGCEQRIASLSERIAQLRATQSGLSELALQSLSHPEGLNRKAFRHFNHPTCRALLAAWLRQKGAPKINSKKLEELSHRLRMGPGNGRSDLGKSWQMQWSSATIQLVNNERKL